MAATAAANGKVRVRGVELMLLPSVAPASRLDQDAVDITDFFAASRAHIVAGKGGVGKTTMTAALALVASRAGLSVLVLDVEGRPELPGLFGRPPLGFAEATLAPGVRGRWISADDALMEYLADHGLRRLARTMFETGVVDVLARATPGMQDILVLGKIKQLERTGAADVILVDAPASGHAISFLRSPRGLLDAVRRGPVHTQAREVLELLTDGHRCQVLLAALPEETPVNELVETAFSLEEDIGIKLGPVLLNGSYPQLDLPGEDDAAALVAGRPDAGALLEAAVFRRRRAALQARQADRLAAALPLQQLRTSFRFVPALGPDDVDALAGELADAIAELT
ncbi:MAG: P-loop NTPase [Acidimicrobiia bacterium]|nr:P-loop NTPase [Acidimicrobiia bacterium]